MYICTVFGTQQGGLYRGGVLTSRVAFKRGSTILCSENLYRRGWGVLTSRVAFKRGSTILCSENFYRGGWGVLTSRVAFKRGSTILCSENLYRGGVSSHQGWPLKGAPLYSVVRTFTEGGGVSSRQGWPLRGAPLYSLARTFTEGVWGVLTSRVAFKRGSTLLCSENLYRGGVSLRQGWPSRGAPLYSVVRTFTEGGVLTSRVAFKRGSTLLCSENLYRGGCPHVKGGL